MDWSPEPLQQMVDSQAVAAILFGEAIVLFIAEIVLGLFCTSIWLRATNSTRQIFFLFAFLFFITAWASDAPIILAWSDPQGAIITRMLAASLKLVLFGTFLMVYFTRKVHVVDIQRAIHKTILAPHELNGLSTEQLGELVQKATNVVVSRHAEKREGEADG
jgi:hypothetical protein